MSMKVIDIPHFLWTIFTVKFTAEFTVKILKCAYLDFKDNLCNFSFKTLLFRLPSEGI